MDSFPQNRVLYTNWHELTLYAWREKILRKIKSIVRSITRQKSIRPGIVTGQKSGELKILKSLKKFSKDTLSIIKREFESGTTSLPESIPADSDLNLSRSLEASAFVVTNRISDFSQSTILTETVDNIVKLSAGLQENCIETWLKRGERKDLKFKSSVSTVTAGDNSTAVLIKYVLTN